MTIVRGRVFQEIRSNSILHYYRLASTNFFSVFPSQRLQNHTRQLRSSGIDLYLRVRACMHECVRTCFHAMHRAR